MNNENKINSVDVTKAGSPGAASGLFRQCKVESGKICTREAAGCRMADVCRGCHKRGGKECCKDG